MNFPHPMDDKTGFEATDDEMGLNTKCVRCGYPEKEHSYNGACYGLCGKFVAPKADEVA
jgi:hypothetical protein